LLGDFKALKPRGNRDNILAYMTVNYDLRLLVLNINGSELPSSEESFEQLRQLRALRPNKQQPADNRIASRVCRPVKITDLHAGKA
jgi:hypothetical protein